MAQATGNQELVDRFVTFYRNYRRDAISELAQRYPNEQRSLYIDYDDLYQFDADLAEDYRAQPEQMQEYAEEALRQYDLPADVKLGRAHVRLRNLADTVDIRNIRVHDDHIGRLVAVTGIVRKATDVRPRVTEAAFECQRCGTMTYIPQTDGAFQEPHECQGCERQGPFRVNHDQSEFVDSQKLRVQESPEGLRGGETPQSIDVNIEDDVTGKVTAGDHVTVTGVLHIEQMSQGNEKSAVFDLYMDGVAVEVEDEEFENMDIDQDDVAEILELSEDPDIYDRMVGSIAPTIYGFEEEKLAMALQLFSGVTKHLPDGSRLRGDLHMLLIGDPGTGKCTSGDTLVSLGNGTRKPIRDLVEANLDDPKPVDDGVWDDADFEVLSMADGDRIEPREATKVWKREAPDTMLRVRTASGREIDVTPSHPLFVQSGVGVSPERADSLTEGDFVAALGRSPTCEAESSSTPRWDIATDGGIGTETQVTNDLSWDRIESIETVTPEDDWVYDLEVAGTHSYVSNGVVSHNSQLLSYIRNVAPRSVYTSGKGSSAAGLCVTGDTLVHTERGFEPIRDIVTADLPDPVATETSVEKSVDVRTFDREAGETTTAATSHAWRMPEKPCRRIETSHGKELEASVNTPILVCGENGVEWREISEIESGDHVAVPRYDGVDRSRVSVRDFLELTTEKIRLAEESITFLRESLCDEFGTLRDAAAALDLSEDFIYLHLKNRHVPLEKLDRMLDAVGATRDDVQFDRLMLRHGDSITVPETFDEDLMYLLGLVFGDGDISLDRRDENRGMVRISNGDEALLERAADIFAAKFDKRPEIEYQDDRVPCIRVCSATVARLFANAGMQTPKESLALAPELTGAEHGDAFLRGLMDADGSVSVRDEGGSSVLMSTISDDLARQVQLLLETYGVRARVRERDRRGRSELEDGRTIESKHVQYFVEIYGADVDQYAASIGFECVEKQQALGRIVSASRRRRDELPVGTALAAANGTAGEYHNNVSRGDNPGRARAREMLTDIDLGPVEADVREAVDADLRWDEVVAAVDTGHKEVFDLTVPETHNFVGNGIVTHNTAAAVRDDFGDGQQWTLEAGALVLADKGIAAIDELDKMRCVTGDTLVHLGDGRIQRIGELARTAAEDGEIEQLPNGRTIRDADLDVWTMDDTGSLVRRSVTAIHEYDAPESLTQVTLTTGERLTATDDHPFFVMEGGERVTKPAMELDEDDWVCVPKAMPTAASDGGTVIVDENETPLTDSSVSDPEQADVTWRRVESVESVQTEEVESGRAPKVYDLTVEGTHNFVANGMVVHNSEDRSAMHQGLEQQEISVSKAGINATLKSRCSLLGAANPKHGRFDQYEPIGEQIDLEPALISRFDLIFTVTDQPDPEEDARLAEHILETNYAGELRTQRAELSNAEASDEEIEAATEEVQPSIDADLFRKYIAYAKRSCYPRMTDEARETIQEFYVDMRSRGIEDDSPVPITARKIEALVRLAEASARVRLSDTVEQADAERVVDIVRSSMEDIGVDPETGQFDADVVETGTSKSQRDRIKNLKGLIEDIEAEYEEGAPVEEVLDRAGEIGLDRSKAEGEIESLKKKGEVYEPSLDHLRTT